MSKDHEGDIKQYIHTGKAWYAKIGLEREGYVDEVMFGFYAPGGGTSGEIGMRWINLGEQWVSGEKRIQVTPHLECFNDAWHTLAQFKDVIDELAELDDVDITPKQFCQLLDHCGFTDNTPRKYEDSYPDRNLGD